jgi:hypothetical protein
MTFSTLSSREAGRHRTGHADAPTGRQTEQRTGRQDRGLGQTDRNMEQGRTGTLGRQDIEAASK